MLFFRHTDFMGSDYVVQMNIRGVNMTGNQIWAITCVSMCAFFAISAILFALLKEKGAMLISGFNTIWFGS